MTLDLEMDLDGKDFLNFQDLDLLFDQFEPMQKERLDRSVKPMTVSPLDLKMCCIALVSCGFRPNEIFNLPRKSFDLQNRLITLSHTKTGFKRCNCSKWDKKTLLSSDPDCKKCQGLGKFRVTQYTTIWPNAAIVLESYFKARNLEPDEVPFPYYRQIINEYVKEAAQRAGIRILSVKDVIVRKNMHSYIFRGSCARNMRELGATYELRQLKLRHSNKSKDVTIRYDGYTVNDLLKWERDNVFWPKL
jgi:integrase